MKFFITIFALLALLGSPVVFAEDSKEAATTADSGSDISDEKADDKKAGDKEASEEEPDCD